MNLEGRYQAPGDVEGRGREGPPPAHELLGRRQHEDVRRRAVPAAPGGLRRAAHHGGVSPAWPITYDELEPYYAEAERLYHVHGARGEDPTEPPASGPYPHPPVSHEPRLAQLSEDLAALGLRPFHTPLGIQLDERSPHASRCIRCNTCDGFPCLVGAKSDAQVCGVEPALAYPNVDAAHRREGDPARDEPLRARGDEGRRRARRTARGVRVVDRRRLVRRDQLGRAAPAFGERPAPPRPGQRLGRRRPALHGPRELGDDGDLALPEPHRVPEVAVGERFLLRRRGLAAPDGAHLVRRASSTATRSAAARLRWCPGSRSTSWRTTRSTSG